MQLQQAIDEFILYIEIERNYSENTISSYELDLNMFHDFLVSHNRSLDVNEINKTIVRRFIQEKIVKDNLKPRTMHRKISSLRSFTKYCTQENILENDFMIGIERPRTDDKLPVYMTLPELRKLFKYLDKNIGRFGIRNNLMFKLLATSGMRRSELVSLIWEQIDLTNNTIKVYGKGKKERLVPLHPITLPLFETYRSSSLEYQLHPSQPVFLNRSGNRLNPRGLHKIFKETLERAGLPSQRFSLHHLRHTFATLLLQENKENVDLRIVQELLGHESLATTQVYTHVDFSEKQKAIHSFVL